MSGCRVVGFRVLGLGVFGLRAFQKAYRWYIGAI